MLEKLADKFERKVKSSATMRFFSCLCVSLTTASVCLNFQASLRESWLDDMMHVLEGEALGQDAATVEAAFKRHEAISTDVKARVSDITCKLPVSCMCVFWRETRRSTRKRHAHSVVLNANALQNCTQFNARNQSPRIKCMC